ncbi:MAG: hypothetical protein ACRCXE_01130, partial [Metamycoplasmataceae bacterium]
MKKNIKKIATGVVLAGGFLVPLAAIAASGSLVANNNTNYNIESKTNPKVRIIEVKDDQYMSIETLSKVFNGLDNTSLENVNVSFEGEVSAYSQNNKIVLTAKDGFLLNGVKSITSEEFVVLPMLLEISPTSNDKVEMSKADLMTLSDMNSLNQLFTGVDSEDLDYIDISFGKVKNNSNLDVILTAKDDFQFEVNGQEVKTISTSVFVNEGIDANFLLNDITVNHGPMVNNELTSEQRVEALEYSSLQPFFTGITWDTIDKIEKAEWIQNSYGSFKIVLTAKYGYLFSPISNTLTSNDFVLKVNFTAINPQIVDASIADLKRRVELREITALQTFFGGIDWTNIDKIESAKWEQNSFGSFKVTIKVRLGYLFNESSNQLVSNDFVQQLDVTNKDLTSLETKYINQELIENLDLDTLKILFDGIDAKTLENLEKADLIQNEDGTFKVILKSKLGYLFGNRSNTVSSSDIIIYTKLDINNKEVTDIFTNEEINQDILDTNFDILNTFFEGSDFEESKIAKAELSGNSYDAMVITLTAQEGLGFENGSKTLVSQSFTINTIINLEALVINNKINDDLITAPLIEGLDAAALALLFNGDALNTTNIKSATLVDNGDETLKVILEANDGFVFVGNETTLESKTFSYTVKLNVVAKVIENKFNDDLITDI